MFWGYPKGPCTQIVDTVALKVVPLWVLWGQSLYYLGYLGTWTLRVVEPGFLNHIPT